MLRQIVPGKPNVQGVNDVDPTLVPLLAAASAGEPLEPLMQAIVRRFGFESFMYAMTTDPRPHHDSRSYVWTTLPHEWITEYDTNAYVEVDPRITLTWGRTTPLVWDAATIGGNAKVRHFLDHAAKYRIRSGVAVAFSDPTHARFGVAFNSPISPVDELRRQAISDCLGSLMVLTAGFHDLFMANVVSRGLPPSQQGAPLSPRERQCLQMAAHGLTSADIGLKLGITERTANYHFCNLISKLGVLNRHEAIAKALTNGLIGIDPI
jgi:LuxR family transcriptional regulator, quorum-sensing system regulator LasR